VGLEQGPLIYLEEKVAASIKKIEITVAGIRHADHVSPLSAKVGNNFADKQLLLSEYSLLVDSGHGV
jgi:hypothetical protein